jgi:ABC-2 type transport system permease protein
MNTLTYTRYELLRTVRNRRLFILSFAFPLIIYLLVAESAHAKENIGGTGLSLRLYYMVGYASFGTMAAMLSCGARIALERQVGWTRQLRISPLSTRAYFSTKVLTAYMMAIVSMLVLYGAGISVGVSLHTSGWLGMTGLILLALVPFAALGILLGHLLNPDSIGPALGGGVALLSLLGGSFFPLGQGNFLAELAQYLPPYWLVQAGHVGVGGAGWGIKGVVVIAAWTVVLSVLAARAYRRDNGRV